ncbi:MAG: DUF4105 domain-containing protein [Chitinophagaceae bacterium]
MRKIILLIFIFFCKTSFTQSDTASRLQISLITCAPGNELYSIFGHTAIRVFDSTNGSDVFYNYGTFDFDDPNFLAKFVRGKLLYRLSVDAANDFFATYQFEHRTITEQILQLSATEKNAIQEALLINLSGNNKYYKYDFLFDNCTTRARDVIKKHSNFTQVQLVPKGTTFRNMLYVYLDSSGMCWSKLGIDILLGSKIDKPVTLEQSNFLPDYLMFALDSSNTKSKLIQDKKEYKAYSINSEFKNNYTPLITFSALFLLMLLMSFSKNNVAKKMYHYISTLFIFLTGLLGIVLLFMWFGTDHNSCSNNYNLLWALPTNLIALFFINKSNDIKKKYFKVAFVLSLLLLATWFILPQQFNIALAPFVLMMSFIYRKYSL